MSAPLCVIDASVGAKWFRDEPGSDEAVQLMRQHGVGELTLAVPVVFMHEVLDVARRTGGLDLARQVLESLARDEIVVVGADADFLGRVLQVCGRLDCTVYDAAAPALAELLNAQLVSADRRAHADFPGVRIIG
jgi:predicted nucleic acid-binding protein